MGCCEPNEFARRYDLGFLPESRKLTQIARHEIVGTGHIGTFPGIDCRRDRLLLPDAEKARPDSFVTDELQQLEPQALADFEFGAEAGFLTIGLYAKDK